MSENKQEAAMTSESGWTWRDGSIQAELQTAFGPVTAHFTVRELNHVCVVIGKLGDPAYTNDDRPALTLSGSRYSGSVHLWAEPTDKWPNGWGPAYRFPDYPEVNFNRWVRGTLDTAPRSHRDKMLTAISVEVRKFVTEHPEVQREVYLRNLSDAVASAEAQVSKLNEQYTVALRVAKKARADLDAALSVTV